MGFPPKGQVIGSNPIGVTNIFNDLQIFLLFFENVFVRNIAVAYSDTTHIGNVSHFPTLNKSSMPDSLGYVFMPHDILQIFQISPHFGDQISKYHPSYALSLRYNRDASCPALLALFLEYF